jgi:predicted ester cyclase
VILGVAVVAGLVLASAQKKPANREPEPNMRTVASPEQNKNVARRVFDDLFTQGRYGEVNQIYASNCTVHFGNRTERLAQAVEEGKGWRSAAPDLVMTADEITVNGDMVNVSWTARGTHTGSGNGLKPTGRKVFVRGTSRFRVENGKIVEAWNSEYRDELFRQIGVSKTRAFVYEKALELQASLSELFPGSAR